MENQTKFQMRQRTYANLFASRAARNNERDGGWLDLAPGAFHVAGRVTATDVPQFYGEEAYASSACCSVPFYIAQ